MLEEEKQIWIFLQIEKIKKKTCPAINQQRMSRPLGIHPGAYAAERAKAKEAASKKYEKMTVVQLKDLLKDEGLPSSGKKSDLIALLTLPPAEKQFFKQQAERKKEATKTKKAGAMPKRKSALQVYREAVKLMGAEKFIEETQASMKKYEKSH